MDNIKKICRDAKEIVERYNNANGTNIALRMHDSNDEQLVLFFGDEHLHLGVRINREPMEVLNFTMESFRSAGYSPGPPWGVSIVKELKEYAHAQNQHIVASNNDPSTRARKALAGILPGFEEDENNIPEDFHNIPNKAKHVGSYRGLPAEVSTSWSADHLVYVIVCVESQRRGDTTVCVNNYGDGAKVSTAHLGNHGLEGHPLDPEITWEFDDDMADGRIECQLTIDGSGNYMTEISMISESIIWANSMVEAIRGDIQIGGA